MLTYVLSIVGTSPHQAISNQREKTKKERKYVKGDFRKETRIQSGLYSSKNLDSSSDEENIGTGTLHDRH